LKENYKNAIKTSLAIRDSSSRLFCKSPPHDKACQVAMNTQHHDFIFVSTFLSMTAKISQANILMPQ